MARPKGKAQRPNRYWSIEEKLRIVKRIENGEETWRKIAQEEKLSSGVLYQWVKVYRDKGVKGLKNQKKPGNPLSRYQNKKALTEIEKLEYENMKLKVENLRLKKGYSEKELMIIRQKRSSKKNTQ